jgi:hypothetical protein
MAADADRARAERPKPLHWLTKWRNRFLCVTHTRQEERKGREGMGESPEITDWRIGDTGSDGRKVVGHRQFGAVLVPVWSVVL